MAFSLYGTRRSFSRSESVDIVTREVTLLPNTPDEKHYVDIREYLKDGEIYAHGIYIPVEHIKDLVNDLIEFIPEESA